MKPQIEVDKTNNLVRIYFPNDPHGKPLCVKTDAPESYADRLLQYGT